VIHTLQLGGLGRIGGAALAVAGALDSYTTNLWAAYGITRQIGSTLYAGSAIRVRKSTGGDTTTEQDIGFVGTALDTAALATFAGSETVVVTKFYDQSGNGRDMVQATGSKQPRIVNAGAYDGFVRFDGSDDELATSATTGTGTVMSVSTKTNYRNNTLTQVVYSIGAGGAGSIGETYIESGFSRQSVVTSGPGGFYSIQHGSTTFPSQKVWGYIHELNALTQSASALLYGDGSSIGTSSAGTGVPTGNFTAQTVRLGAVGGASWASSDVYSFALWESNQDASMAAIAAAMA
jgi:hypothetical protein